MCQSRRAGTSPAGQNSPGAAKKQRCRRDGAGDGDGTGSPLPPAGDEGGKNGGKVDRECERDNEGTIAETAFHPLRDSGLRQFLYFIRSRVISRRVTSYRAGPRPAPPHPARPRAHAGIPEPPPLSPHPPAALPSALRLRHGGGAGRGAGRERAPFSPASAPL